MTEANPPETTYAYFAREAPYHIGLHPVGRIPTTLALSHIGPSVGRQQPTPHVAGCLALLAQACQKSGSSIVPARVQEALENTAVKINGQTVDKENHYGAGRVDVYKAYQYGKTQGWW